jgi:hypothetical protein
VTPDAFDALRSVAPAPFDDSDLWLALKSSYFGDYHGTEPQPANRAAGATCSVEPFTTADIAETLAWAPGSGEEGGDWLWAGRLLDGRWAFLSAWCDYTGWG